MARHPLGRFVEHDPRSRQYSFAAAAPIAAVSTIWPTRAPCLDQGRLGSCTGNAMAQLLNCDRGATARRRARHASYLRQRDAVKLYSAATRLDSAPGTYPPEDTGSSGLAVAKAARNAGFITRYSHTFTFDAFRTAIQFQPVIAGTLWTEPMNHPDRDGTIHVGDISDATVLGGHEYLVRGIDYEHYRVVCRQSWGPRWGAVSPDGVSGTFYLSMDDFDELLHHQGDVTVPQLL